MESEMPEEKNEADWNELAPLFTLREGTLIQTPSHQTILLGMGEQPLEFYSIRKEGEATEEVYYLKLLCDPMFKDSNDFSFWEQSNLFKKAPTSFVKIKAFTIEELLCCNFELARLWFAGLVKGEHKRSDLEQWFKTLKGKQNSVKDSIKHRRAILEQLKIKSGIATSDSDETEWTTECIKKWTNLIEKPKSSYDKKNYMTFSPKTKNTNLDNDRFFYGNFD